MQNKTYRKDEVGMVGDGVQFITFLSCDSISEFAEGYEPDEEPEEEGEWFAVFKYEDLVKQLHAELKYFNTNFNVTIEDVNYGTDVIISIDFDTLHTMSDEDFAKLLKYDVTDLQYDFVWEALNRVVEIVFEKASD
jgi:hypothetical protein